MMCEDCHEAEASIVFTHVDDGKKETVHLCPVCAKSRGLLNLTGMKDTDMQFEIDPENIEDDVSSADDKVDICPNCKMTFDRFKDRYRLGCAVCYTAFRERLRPILRKVHGAETHTGKLLSQTQRNAEEMDAWTIEVLQRRLQAAIEREEFEEAAQLRDKIELLKAKTSTTE